MIPFVDLNPQYRELKHQIDAAVARVLESGQFVLGEEVEALEKEFARYCGAAHGIAVSSGTSALHLALLAAGIGEGDEVITVPFTFVASVAAICYVGAKPVFVDIDPLTYTMQPARLEEAITPRARAVIPVHLYGRPADMDPILEIARRRNLTVIEDAAQAHGATYRGRRAGSLGDLGCFSFYPTKNLGACGEGGMVVTSHPEHAARIRRLRAWGQGRSRNHLLRGLNCRMHGLQGAILRVKLSRLDAWNERRRRHAARYDELLAGSRVRRPEPTPDGGHVYHLYTVACPGRDAVRRKLEAEGIQTGVYYPTPVHLQEGYADLGHRSGSFPFSEKAAGEVLSLPMYPALPDGAIERVCAALDKVF